MTVVATVAVKTSSGTTVTAVVATAAASTSPGTTVTAKDNVTCPTYCTCKSTKVVCVDSFPDSIPDSTEELVLDMSWIRETGIIHFCKLNTRYVKKLTFAYPIYDVGNIGFSCIEKLEILVLSRLMTTKETEFKFFKSLSNLTNVKQLVFPLFIFDLEELLNVLSAKEQLPQLRYLGLLNADDLFIDQSFIDALFVRPVSHLDLRFSTIKFDFHNSAKLCDKLMTLNLHSSYITEINLPFRNECIYRYRR